MFHKTFASPVATGLVCEVYPRLIAVKLQVEVNLLRTAGNAILDHQYVFELITFQNCETQLSACCLLYCEIGPLQVELIQPTGFPRI